MKINFVDTTLRDGNHSLWGAVGITTPIVLSIAPVLDRVGFSVVEFITSTHMAVSVRRHRENPWERIRRAKELMPNTPLGFLTTGMRFITWDRTPEAGIERAAPCLRTRRLSTADDLPPYNARSHSIRPPQAVSVQFVPVAPVPGRSIE